MLQKGFSKTPNQKLHFGTGQVWLLVVAVVVVIAAGFLVWRQWQAPAEVEQPPADETADWQTYRNEEYGYEISYPKSWGFEEYPTIKAVGFGSPPVPEGTEGGSPVVITVLSNSLQEVIRRFQHNLTHTRREDIIMYGLISIKIEGELSGLTSGPAELYEGLMTIGVFVQRNSLVYEIRFLEQNSGDQENHRIFNRMLSTFRFLE